MSVAARIKLHRFHPDQADELVRMWRASFQEGVGIVDPHPISEQREYLLSMVVPNNTVIVATLESEIVGFLAASSQSIDQLYVHTDYHRNGIGAKLLGWAKAQSCGSLWLYTFECNRNAARFYEHHGFSLEERGFEEMWQLPDLKYVWSQSDAARKGAQGGESDR